MAFYQDNLENLKGDLSEVFCEFHVRKIIVFHMNETYVCLIPKKERDDKMKDFRL